MAITIDVRGLACPQPVIQTRNALKDHTAIITIVDNETSRHNVSKMAEKMGCSVETDQKADGIYLRITKEEANDAASQPAPTCDAPVAGPLVLVISDEYMGRGDPGLGEVLIRAFFHTLGEVQPLPKTIVFFNSGVKLVVEGSKVLEDLQALQEQDIEILACGTCLDYYHLKDQIRIGEISNMYTIAETLLQAGKIVNL